MMAVGSTYELVCNVDPDSPDITVTWSTDDPSVATVENGIVTGVGGGTTYITASVPGKNGTLTASCNVNVIARMGMSVSSELITVGGFNDDPAELEVTVTNLSSSVDPTIYLRWSEDGPYGGDYLQVEEVTPLLLNESTGRGTATLYFSRKGMAEPDYTSFQATLVIMDTHENPVLQQFITVQIDGWVMPGGY